MKLTVKNFGPIKSAKVDVKPLTVFVGPSNTGKSYLAMLIYITTKAFKSLDRGFIWHIFISAFGDKAPIQKSLIDNDEAIREAFSGCLNIIRKQWADEGIRCFGEEWRNIIEQNGDSASVVVSSDDGKVTLDFLSAGNGRSRLSDVMVKKIKDKILSGLKDDDEFMRTVKILEETDLAGFAQYEMLKLIDFPPNSANHDDFPRNLRGTYLNEHANPHYLPAVRGGLMQSHRILVSTLIDRAPVIGLTGATEIVPFTGVLADFLRKLLMISGEHFELRAYRQRRRKPIESVSALSEKIEREIMHGEITINKLATRYPDFRYQFVDKVSRKRDISLMHASSSVSELTPLVLFIRHYLSPNDIFIVEEPEAHLHPGAQRAIAGVLVELVNAGVNVVITTHSDVILEQISNLMHADKVPKAKVFGRAAKGRTLSQEKAGCYAFNSPTARGGGTAVKSVAFDAQTGFLTDDHLDVSSKLYNETVELFNLKVRDENDRA